MRRAIFRTLSTKSNQARDSSAQYGNKVFFEGNGYLAVGVVEDDGAYTLNYQGSPEIPLGDYVVFVGPPTSYMDEAEFRALEQKVAAECRQRGEEPPPFPDWVLPAKFYRSTTSPLRETVEWGFYDEVFDGNWDKLTKYTDEQQERAAEYAGARKPADLERHRR